MKKRFYSLLLAVVFALALVPVTPSVSAAGEVTVTSSSVETTYGDVVVLSTMVSATGDTDITQGKVTFKIGEEELGNVESISEEGSATLTINNDDDHYKKLFGEDGHSTVTVDYAGTEEGTTAQGEINVTMQKKELTFSFEPTQPTYAYTGSNEVEGILTPNTLDGDKVGEDDVTVESVTATVDTADAGEDKSVTVKVTLGGADKDFYTVKEISGVKVTITKAQLKVETAPTAQEGLIYDGNSHNLVTAGTASTGGKMQYSLNTNSSWQDSIPQGKYVGTYSVWYKAVATDATNYTDSEPGEIQNIEISKATLTDDQITAPTAKTELKYTGGALVLVEAGKAPDGCTMKYAVKGSSDGAPSDGDWKDSVDQITGTTVGSYNVYWKVDGGTNYNEYTPGSGSPISVTIGKAALELSTTPQLVKDPLTYTGTAQELIQTAGNCDQGTISYFVKKGDNNTPSGDEDGWQTEPNNITGTEAGTYYVWYKVESTDKTDYSDTEVTQISGSVTISPAKPSIVVTVTENPAYGSDITLTATVSSGSIAAGNITGTVTFTSDGASLGNGTKGDGNIWTLIIQGNEGAKQKALFDNKQVTATYSGDDNIATADGSKDVTVAQKELTFTFTAQNKEYDANTTIDGTFDNLTEQLLSGDQVEVGDFTAKTEDENVGAKKNVTVTVSTLKGKDAQYYKPGKATSNTVEITKANSNESAAPTGASGLTYKGIDQGLVQTAGTATGGTMKYFVGEKAPEDGNDSWKTEISFITGKDAGTYRVWYYVDGDDNHNDTGAQSIEVPIAQKEVILTWEGCDDLTYDGKPKNVTADFADEQIISSDKDQVTVKVEGGNAIDAGKYNASASLEGNRAGNYVLNSETSSQLYTIQQATLDLSVTGSAIIYGDTLSQSSLNGTAKIQGSETVINGTWAWDNGSVYPSVSDSNSAQYTVKFTPTSSSVSNFTDDSLTTKITVTVNPFALTPLVDSVDGKIYDGTTAVTGSPTMTFKEDLGKAPFNTNLPTVTGTFTFTDKNVGKNKTVEVTGITLTSNAANYTLSTNAITGGPSAAEITAKEVSLTWNNDTGLTYDGKGESVNVTVSNGDRTNAGTYTATATGLTNGEGGIAENYKLPSDGTQEKKYTISPAEVSFQIIPETKTDWPDTEANADPNEGGYAIQGSGTDYALALTYDSYAHTVNVVPTDEIISVGESNGFTVTYQKDGRTLTTICDAGTYDIMVNLTPVSGDIYNFAFAGQPAAMHSLKIGTIEVKPYEVTVTWSHLSYVYHGHAMHPVIQINNTFKNDKLAESVPGDFDQTNYNGDLLAFAETSGADVDSYEVKAELYGQNAGNYRISASTASNTVNIVAAPVTFTVGDNIWVTTKPDHPTAVTLRAAWGEVTTEPDAEYAANHQYPKAGSAITEDLNTTIEYRRDGEKVQGTPAEPGTYDVYVSIGNMNFRHAATANGDFHLVGELVITDDESSLTFYTVTFEPGYTLGDGKSAPAKMERVLPGQTVVLPAESGTNPDNNTYDMTRGGNWKMVGWSYEGTTYLPNEEFHMPSRNVTFTAQWAQSHKVEGTVKQYKDLEGTDTTALSGATLELKQGEDVLYSTISDGDGKFTFENLTPGLYNLVITYNGNAKIVKTFVVEITNDDVTGVYILPSGALNTVVEVDSGDLNVVVDLDGITEDEEIFTAEDKDTVNDGGTVEFKMEVEEKNTDEFSDEIEEVPVSAEQIGMVLDLSLTKTVTPKTGATSGPEAITDSKVPVTTTIHLPPELQGKSSYTIYRFHEEGGKTEMQTITTSPNDNNEVLKVVRDGTAIELQARLYSLYVLTWTQSSGASAFRVGLPEETPHGTVKADRPSAYRGSAVTLTVTPDEGYHLGALSVLDMNGKAVALTDNGDGTYTFTMPYGQVSVKADFIRCGSLDFTDLDTGAWYHAYTDYVIDSGLMRGIGGKLFDPEGTVSRAQMVTVLWNRSERPVVNYYMTYADVSEEAWYAEAIRWATSEGIVGGYGNGKFGPEDPITREQMAAMLYRYECKYGDGGFTGDWMFRLPYGDLESVSDWAYEPVAWCHMKGVIQGRDNNVFDPLGFAKRSEMAAILTRYDGLETE